MVVVKLSSGLGNQLFMYAFFQYLKQENADIDIYFDISSFSRDVSHRQSELEIVYPKYPVDHGISLLAPSSGRLIRKFSRYLLTYFSDLVIINEDNFRGINLPLNRNRSYYFTGFWQTDYFVEKLVNKRNLFSPKEDMPTCIIDYYNQIISSRDSLAIHVRRGDYFSDLYIERYGVCTEKYYRNAINAMMEKVLVSRIFIFSDDLIWVKKHLVFPENIEVVFVDNFKINSYWAIYLMSLCENNIISNSTFGWWGAYLNPRSKKIVISPKKWIHDSDEHPAPLSWLRVEV